jgi:hypothetical protein
MLPTKAHAVNRPGFIAMVAATSVATARSHYSHKALALPSRRPPGTSSRTTPSLRLQAGSQPERRGLGARRRIALSRSRPSRASGGRRGGPTPLDCTQREQRFPLGLSDASHACDVERFIAAFDP